MRTSTLTVPVDGTAVARTVPHGVADLKLVIVAEVDRGGRAGDGRERINGLQEFLRRATQFEGIGRAVADDVGLGVDQTANHQIPAAGISDLIVVVEAMFITEVDRVAAVDANRWGERAGSQQLLFVSNQCLGRAVDYTPTIARTP